MATTYRTRDGRTVTVLSAAERVTGTRGRWEVQETSVGGFTVIINGTKRAALAHAAVAARTERQLRRDLGDTRIPTPRHFVAAGIKHATCGAESPKLSTADWARVTCTACTSERDRRADAARAARPATALEMVADVMLPEPTAAELEDAAVALLDTADTEPTPTPDDGHRAIVRPASSRFIGDDARNGLTAQCWECGWEIICHPHDATYRHVADAVERAHGEARLENLLRMEHLHETALIENAERDMAARADVQNVMDTAWIRLTRSIEDAHGEALAEDRARTAIRARETRSDFTTETGEHWSVSPAAGPVAGLDAHAANERTIALIVQMRTTTHQATEHADRITCECGITATDRDALARRHARSPAVLPGVFEAAARAGGAR